MSELKAPDVMSLPRVAVAQGAGGCPVCQSAHTHLRFDGDDGLSLDSVGSSRTKLSHGRILQCRNCGLCFRVFRPSPDQLGQLYREADDGMYEAEALNRLKTARRHRNLARRYCRTPGTVIDVGCASGLFLKEMVDAGWKAFGVEPSRSQFKRADKLLGNRAVLESCVLEEATLPRQADLVTLWDVLEHVPQPLQFVARCASLLRPGGFLFLNTPRSDSFIARMLGSHWPLLLAEHLNYFTIDSLRLCGQPVGLELIDTGARPVSFSLGYILHRLAQHHIPFARAAQRASTALHIESFSLPILMGEVFAAFRKQGDPHPSSQRAG